SYNEHGWEAGMLERMLVPPLRGSEGAGGGATGATARPPWCRAIGTARGARASRRWCESIVTAWDSQLAGHYPFLFGKAVRDARLADVEKFFMPKTGHLRQYFADSLAGEIGQPAQSAL